MAEKFYSMDNDQGNPDVVLMLPAEKMEDHPGWLLLEDHVCGGFSCQNFEGLVLPLSPAKEHMKLLWQIAEEFFSMDCADKNLDYGVTEAQRTAYQAWLSGNGLYCGDADVKKLIQGIYPLDPTSGNLARLGIADVRIPDGAQLLILGHNCD